MTPCPTAIDLFAGSGGATQGLKDAGYDVLAAVEIDGDASKSYHANHPEVVPLFFDVRDVDPVILRDALQLKPGDLTLVTACPPCQGFSTLRRGAYDPATDLIEEVQRFLEAFAPRAFAVENVPGIAKDARFADLIAWAEKEADYEVRVYHVDAADIGAPQRRRRIIALGVREPVVPLAAEFTDALPSGFSITPMTAGQALATAGPIEGTRDALHRARRPTPIVLRRIKAIPVGGNRFDLPKSLRLKCHESVGRSAAGPYARIKADGLAPTMTTRCTTPACGRFVHPTEHRGISLREAALLQMFPPRYQFEGTYGSIERQIGNAVPVRLAEAFGRAVLHAMAVEPDVAVG